MTRILVTGGAGFVGSHVVDRLLADGARVGVVDNLSTGTPTNLRRAAGRGLRDEDVAIVDICSAECASWLQRWRPDVLMHLAAQSSVARSVGAPVRDTLVNVVGTVNLLDAALRAGTTKVVLASSGGTIYGDPPAPGCAVPETAPYHPPSPYGLSKATAGRYLELYGQLFGLAGTVLALGNVYGPRQGEGTSTGVVAEFVAALRSGRRPVIYGDGRQSRDFIYVTDVAEAFLLAAGKADGTVLNVGTGLGTSISDVLALVCETLGRHVEPDLRPDQLGEVRHSVLDVRRAREVLDWRPRIGLREGVRRVVASMTQDPPC